MTATATKQMHEATIGTVVAVGDDVKVLLPNLPIVLLMHESADAAQER